jgi:hypothetical protein
MTKQTFPQGFPAEMRRQLWPLCCGASILSGFKVVNSMTEAELDASIKAACETDRPDFQVFAGESMKPKFTFLTLNSGQTSSPKIMAAIARAGFFKIGEGKPRGSTQSFFLRDTSKTWVPASTTEAIRAETPAKVAA